MGKKLAMYRLLDSKRNKGPEIREPIALTLKALSVSEDIFYVIVFSKTFFMIILVD